MGTRGRRSRALLDPSQEQTSGLVRFSALHALVRHLQPRLSADEGRARLHAAAGPAADRRLHAGSVAGPLHRREYPQGDRRRFRVGRRRPGQRHARPGPADPRHRRARARGRQGRHAGRPVGVRLARNVSRHRLSPHRRDGRRHRSADRAASTRASRARPRRFASKPRSGLPLQDFPIPAYDLIPLKQLSDAHVAVLERVSLSAASSATFPTSTAASRGSRPPRRSPPSSTPCASRRGIRRWSISSTTISSAIARPPRTCCRTWSPGRSSTAIPLSFACEATLNIAKQPEILELMREASFHRHLRRHRDAGGRCAQGDAQGSERRRADDGVDQDAERLRPGGDLRHHPRPRHRLRRHRGAAQGLHRHLADPDADHQSAAGAAEDAAVGSARGGRDGWRTIRRSKATCVSCGRTTRSCRRGAAASPMPTIRSGCSRASTTRSIRPTSTG